MCKEALTESVGGSGQKKKVIRVLLVKTKTKNIEIYSFLLNFIIVTFMFCTGTDHIFSKTLSILEEFFSHS